MGAHSSREVVEPSKVEQTKYIPSADFDNLINGMHASCREDREE